MWNYYVTVHSRTQTHYICIYVCVCACARVYIKKMLVWRSGHQKRLHIKKNYNSQLPLIPVWWSSFQSVLPILSKNMQEISKSRLAEHWQKVDHTTQCDKAGIIHKEENSITRKLLVNTHQKNKANQKTQPGHEQLTLLLHVCNKSS